MRDLRIQYVLAFGMIGTVLPYVSVFFRHAGFSQAQVGYAMAIWSVVLMLSPVLVTMLADARVDPRRLLFVASIASCAGLLSLATATGVAAVMGVWTVFCCTSMPLLALLDGIHFSQQRLREARGEPLRSYPLVRVWGTIGYMVPSVLVFFFLQAGAGLHVVFITGAAFAAVGAIQALRIEDPRGDDHRDGLDGGADDRVGVPRQAGVPTLAAARVLLRPGLAVFVAALLLMQAAGSVHGAYYPVYLTERVGMDEKWIGHVSNVAVFIEMFFVFGCGSLLARFGLKNLLLAAMTLTVLRLGLLAATENAWVAVGTQVFHGIFIIAISVVPPIVLNDAAEDRFRHSMQGVYGMLNGAARAVGNLVAGPIAAWSLAGLYGVAAAVCAVAAVLILVAFRDPARATPAAAAADPDGVDGEGACPIARPAPLPETA
jgi:PPP family 3-phenylpropionic acid transporter